MPGSVILAGARTPIGKLSGALAGFSAMDLGGFAIAAALERAACPLTRSTTSSWARSCRPGQGQITARQAAVNGGISMSVPATTVNKVCLSGLNSIYLADLLIAAGDADVVVAGGHGVDDEGAVPAARGPGRLPAGRRRARRLDDVRRPLLPVRPLRHGTRAPSATTPRPGSPASAQDGFAALSHERAAAAIKDGRFADEIVTVSVPQRKGDPIMIDTDEGVRPGTTAESLGALKPAFDKDGTITAGNASQISDGGAAVIVTSRAKAEALGVTPLGEVVGYGQVAGPDASLLAPTGQRHPCRLWPRPGKTVGDVDLFEINEAFAVVGLASMADLGITDEVTNVNGGAIALGHPIGMSGTRLALTLLHELQRRGGGLGAASLCGGGGQGDALLVRTLP